jgi:hypothetical protein
MRQAWDAFIVEARRRSTSGYGTDHDSKTLPPLPGICLPEARFTADHKSIEISVRPRKGSAAACSRCHQPAIVRAYLLKEAFQQLWDYNSPAWAGRFLDEWCRQVMRARIEPMMKIAHSLRQHRELILNYFRAQKLLSSGVVEGLNNKVRQKNSWVDSGSGNLPSE